MQSTHRKRMYLNKKVASAAVGVYDCTSVHMPRTISRSCGVSVPLDWASLLLYGKVQTFNRTNTQLK